VVVKGAVDYDVDVMVAVTIAIMVERIYEWLSG
jgi:hypothetical protein